MAPERIRMVTKRIHRGPMQIRVAPHGAHIEAKRIPIEPKWIRTDAERIH